MVTRSGQDGLEPQGDARIPTPTAVASTESMLTLEDAEEVHAGHKQFSEH